MKRTKSFDNKPILYLISTPIGNLGEFSTRAIETLNNVDLVAAEDTRNTLSLLKKFNINKPAISLHEHNEREASVSLIKKILDGKSVAYMSDAGYPGISDPGKILVEEAIKNDVRVSVINGSSAFLSGLIPSGLETNHFYFHGFLPSKDSDAKKELLSLANKKETLIFYESPHRILRTINLLLDILGNRKACIARELTKLNEEFIRGDLEDLLKLEETTLKGEMVVVVEGNNNDSKIDNKILLKRYKELLDKKIPSKTCIEIVCEEYQINKNLIKDLVLENKED